MSKVEAVWIDTNIIIYYLKTNKNFTPKVKALVQEAQKGNIQLKIPALVISECVFVLMGKQFNTTKKQVKTALLSFINLPGVIAEEESVIEEALKNYEKKGIDFIDAYIAAHARSVKPARIITENIRDFKGLNVLAEVVPEIGDSD
ncbi:PIN domain-containing protein [Virgibacillus natechei]|uniref:PIN domain-containing protein n=1 Tax=Virgibacillus sp. CBA3643 TaxID=2942278 RepID=UPI0035A2A074